MTARHENTNTRDIWSRLAAPLAAADIAWRQDGKPAMRDGKWFARFVCYVEAGTVRERLDHVVPGEWDLTLEPLPALAAFDDEPAVSFKARLQILGVIREDVGSGKDYKSAATDSFKRAAVRFGIGHELYAMEQNWVQVDGDSKFAKPLEDPSTAYARRYGRKAPAAAAPAPQATLAEAKQALDLPDAPDDYTPPPFHPQANGVHGSHAPDRWRQAEHAARVTEGVEKPQADDVPPCPKCGGRTWDNRVGKKNPKAPDFKCRDRACDGVIWPPKAPKGTPPSTPQPLVMGADEIPY